MILLKIKMSSIIDSIRKKLMKNLKLEDVKIIDNTKLHVGHEFFDKKKLHLKLIIKSPELKQKRRIISNKIIYSALKNEMKKDIHSLQILFE